MARSLAISMPGWASVPMAHCGTLASRSADGLDVAADVHPLDIGAVRELIVPADRRDPLRRLGEMPGQRRSPTSLAWSCSMLETSFRLFLTRWFISFEQHLLSIERRPRRVVTLALDCHAEEVGRALQEGDVMLAELVVRAAVDLEHAERRAVALQDDVHGTADPCSSRISGVRKRSSFSR